MKPRLQRGLRATFVGMATNALLAAGKLVAGLAGHSNALVADAVESFADVFSSLVVWRGLVIAAVPADQEHPYGHGKAEPIASAIVATALLLAAAGIAVGSVRACFQPHTAPRAFTLWVLFGVVAVKEGLFRWVFSVGQSVSSSAVRTDAWHHRSDAITSLAAAIGISVSLIGGPGYESADDVAAIVAAGIIAWNGWRLLHPALDELMDTSPSDAVMDQIRRVAGCVSEVSGVEKCHVRKMGYHYYVDLHIEVNPQMTVEHAHAVAHRVKDELRTRLPRIGDVLVHVEPARRERPSNTGISSST